MSEKTAGIKPKATVEFTLHVHLDDGTTKDIKCIGHVMPEVEPETNPESGKE